MSDEVRALSFRSVADVYDRARPAYPVEAAEWLVGSSDPAVVVELGAGTGKLTETLLAAGHEVVATDPLPEMLGLLRGRAPGARTAVATAEAIPLPSGFADVVVCAQSFHWFDHEVALPEIARVLRPGGVLAMTWNLRDDGIPWVRRLWSMIGAPDSFESLAAPAEGAADFGEVEHRDFRNWQDLRRDDLLDLVRSRSYVVTLPEDERTDVLRRVGELYDEYGRGPDGMRLPYLTRCYRAVVRHREHAPPTPPRIAVGDLPTAASAPLVPPQAVPEDPGTTLIAFS